MSQIFFGRRVWLESSRKALKSFDAIEMLKVWEKKLSKAFESHELGFYSKPKIMQREQKI